MLDHAQRPYPTHNGQRYVVRRLIVVYSWQGFDARRSCSAGRNISLECTSDTTYAVGVLPSAERYFFKVRHFRASRENAAQRRLSTLLAQTTSAYSSASS